MPKKYIHRTLWFIAPLVVVLVVYLINWGSSWDFEVMLRYGKSIKGIMVTDILIGCCEDRYNINYCKLLKKAITKDANSIKQLVLLCFHDGTSYDHGAVIVGLIERLGEDNFISSLGEINVQQGYNVMSYIAVGIEYGGYSYLRDKSIEEAFPKIYAFLKSKTEQ
jgi:hypothetical protein